MAQNLLRRLGRLALASAVLAGLSLAVMPALPPDLGEALMAPAHAKSKQKTRTKRVKRLPVLRAYPEVVNPSPGLRMPDPNRPAYNSGTVAPLAVPRADPVTPGVGPVPQLPSAARESYGDRVVRCTQQSIAGNVPDGQRAVYQHNCSMR